MKPTKKFFEETMAACKKEQERLRMDFERQEGVVRFCQMMIEKENFVQEEANGQSSN